MKTLLILPLFLFTMLVNAYSQSCSYGSYIETPVVSWVSNGNADGYTSISENNLNGSGGNLYSDGANVIYASTSGFQAGDTILITAKYNDTRKGAFVFSSAGSSVFNSGPVLANAFTSSYTTVKYVIPAGIANFSQLNITGETNNGLYINIDAVQLIRKICYTCNVTIAPALSATTVTNSCPNTTYDLTTITASNTPAGSVLTWHTSTPATHANKITNPAAASGSVFYAAFYNTANNCYSGLNGAATTIVNAEGDFDCDGVADKNDIDDDNDGIPDAAESPACFYSQAEMDAFTATSQLVWHTSYPLSNAIDKKETTFSQLNPSAQALTGVTIVELTLKSYVKITAMDLEMGGYALSQNSSSGTIKLQGWDGTQWKDLSDPKYATVTTGTETFVNSKLPAGSFIKFRLLGVSGSSSYARVNEINLQYYNYNASAHPKPSCTTDTDGDGAFNHRDTDSDNDGCSDSYESSVTTSKAANHQFTGTDSNGDGLVDAVDADNDGTPDATITYNDFAVISSLNFCVDSDNDGIGDPLDLDDDNDGVLDVVENNCGTGNSSDNCPDCNEVINWVSWNSLTNSEAKGTMMIENQLVNVTAKITTPHFQNIRQTPWNFGTTDYCSKNESLVNGYINVYNTTSSGPYTITVEFDKPVSNPRLAGASTSGAGIDFPEPVTALTLPRQMASTPLCSDITHIATSEDAWSVLFKGKRTVMTFSSPGFDHQWTLAIGAKSFISIQNCDPVDTDNDGIPNQVDLDSDGDGCPDAVEAGTYNKPGVVASAGSIQNGSGGAVTSTVSAANAIISGPYGDNGFANILQAAADTNTYKYTYTYSYALSASLNACIDTDGDTIPDITDLDDDNDGILDKDECATGTGTNLVKYGAFTEPFANGGQYSTIPSTHWFYANKPYTTPLGYGSPYTVYNYGPNVQASGTFANSNLTGGLFGELEGVNGNPATGINNALNEANGDSSALVYKFQQPLWAGSYDYSFDLRQRLDNANGEDAVAIYNVDTKKIEKILTVVKTNDLPSGSDSPNYKNFSGTFTITTPGNYYLLFMVTVGGTYVGDFLIDRVAVRANNGPVCDLDGDGIPNDKDLDSDGDGCPDAIEGGGPMLASDLRVSSLNGGNSGVGYTGSSINPVVVNLGNTVDTNGVPVIANGGQSAGSSQDGTQTSADCPFQPVHHPDFGVTYINVPLEGNVSTNDHPTPGSVYSNPAPNPANPADCLPVISADGKYTFTCATPGVYVFNVPVCEPAPSTLCKTVPLTITVLDPNDLASAPVANPDYGVTKVNTPVTIPVKANDKCQNGPSCTLGTPSIVTMPVNGSFNPATGVYTPATGYVGMDSLQYAVCDNQSPAKCDTAWVYITVMPGTAPNSTDATDDYVQTLYNTPVSGNVKTNDTDPQGNPQAVTAQTTTIPNKGTLTLNSDGTYNFVPADGFSGPVEFPYTTCDVVVSPTAQACAQATLHILVEPKVPKYDPDFGVTYVNVPLTGNVSTNDATTGSTYSNPAPNPSNPSGCMPTVGSNGQYTFNCATPGTYVFYVPVCEPAPGTSCTTVPLTITVLSGVEDAGPLANPDYATTLKNQPVVVNILSNDKCQNGPSCTLNMPAIVTQPLNGSFDPATGVYTPATNFVGKDSLQYAVCDNQSPAKCDTAWVYIDVLPLGGPNTTQAADDYAQTLYNTPVNGNVQTNDKDPEGNPQTVMPQTKTIDGKGTLTLNADGSYNFVPQDQFYGPVDFPYTICDVVTSPTVQACANATLHIMVMPIPDLTPVFRFRRTSLDKGQSTNAYVDVTNLLVGVADPTKSLIRVRIAKPSAASGYSFTSNGTMTNITVFGTTAVNNSDWDFTEDAVNLTFILKPGKIIRGSAISRIGFTVTRANANNTASKVAVTAVIRANSGGEINNSNNTIGAEVSSNND